MWKKDEGPTAHPSTESRAPSTASVSKSTSTAGTRATIGPSISIKGEVTGSEDLLIQGEVDGSVTLAEHAIGVGSEGRVRANIIGRVITVEGRVEGDLTAAEQIILRGSAQVHGDIKAPRVVLEDGATFRGLVDMGTTSMTSASSTSDAKGKSDKSGSSASSGATASSSSGSSAAGAGKSKEAGSGASRASA